MLTMLAWCNNLSKMAVAMTLSPNISAHSVKLLLEVRIILPFSYRSDMILKNKDAESLSSGW